ncbi:PilZ domain-containing protein [Geothrix edaphica]|uniref:PilZ domain-containing protein n=1 Tax=Geothrix edaphica TaxID=2927976 RepID=A0ABQ5PXC8_9BACT|nr:PilZ domain-containing protein [Geothrix edaphica]GLH66716.1 hypothetical protein GETHED_10800 [Geothrix edaphica]
MATPSERRRFRRVPITYRVKLVVEDRIIAYPTAIDISMGSILLGGTERLPLGSPCGVAILLAEGESGQRVVARGTVVRSDSRGMAVAFSKSLDADSENALRALIHSLSPGAEGVVEPEPGPAGDQAPRSTKQAKRS